MALADITRKEEQINNLTLKFFEILSKCDTPEDFNGLTMFIGATADVGGYAMEYKNIVDAFISRSGKIFAQNYLKDVEKKKNIEKQKKSNTHNLVEEFKENFAKLNSALEELKENRFKDDEEVEYLLRSYYELQSDLDGFYGIVDNEFITQCDWQIEGAIIYLKKLYNYMDETKNSSMGR